MVYQPEVYAGCTYSEIFRFAHGNTVMPSYIIVIPVFLQKGGSAKYLSNLPVSVDGKRQLKCLHDHFFIQFPP